MREKIWSWLMYIAVFIALFSLIVAILMPFIIRNWYIRYDDYSGLAALGPVGDFIGGTTIAFFNLASLLLLIATILMQRKELKVTQKEYEVTNQTMKKQQFETTFFNMLSLHNEIVNTLEIVQSDKKGRILFKFLHEEFNKIYKKQYAIYENTQKGEQEITQYIYNEFYKRFNYIFEHYYEDIYRLIKWIDEYASLKDTEKEMYIAIFRSQLSNYELVLLYYYAAFPEGENMKELLRKYHFYGDHDYLNRSLLLKNNHKYFLG